MRKEPERITLTDGLQEACIKLAEGNPGAVTVLVATIQFGPQIDPQSAFGPYSGMIGFDSEEIYGCRIWMLYKNVCRQNIIHTLALLRAVQMGILTKTQLNHAIDNGGAGLRDGDSDEKLMKVITMLRGELPTFYKSDDPKTLIPPE